jgi:hypothetical protein
MQRFVYPAVLTLIHHAPIGTGECTALAQFALPGNARPLCPHPTGEWTPGEKVKGNFSLPTGTLIAMFHTRHYVNKYGGLAHTALYVRQSQEGIDVVHQFGGSPVKGTLIRFGGSKLPGHVSGVSSRNRHQNIVTPEDDANNYYTVTVAQRAQEP